MRKTVFALVAAIATLSVPVVASAATYQVTTVTNGGVITGKVAFSGSDPAPDAFPISKDNDVCGTGNREIDFVNVSNGTLTGVVVYLDKVDSGKDFSVGDGELDQKGCEFRPFFQVMRNGKNLKAMNSDPVGHNIHTYEQIGRAKRTVLNVSQTKQGSVINKTINLRRGVGMKVECDKHDFMHGFVFVAKNPYYAVVGKDGTFKIDDVPPGTYMIKAWHGVLGEKKASVTVEGGKTAKVDFEFK